MTIPVAYAAGIAAFFSPCVLPLLPVWLAFMGGNKSDSRLNLLFNLIFFVAGFSLIFTLLGASASALGRLLLGYQVLLTRIAALILIIFGLQMLRIFELGILHRKLGFEFKPQKNPLGYFMFGIVLAVGWTPCIGIILASILMLAGSLETVTQGMLLLFIFSIGFATPFFAVGMLIGPAPVSKISRRISDAIQKIAGSLLIVMGLLLLFNRWTWLQSFFL